MGGLKIQGSGDEIANLDQHVRHQITEHPDHRRMGTKLCCGIENPRLGGRDYFDLLSGIFVPVKTPTKSKKAFNNASFILSEACPKNKQLNISIINNSIIITFLCFPIHESILLKIG